MGRPRRYTGFLYNTPVAYYPGFKEHQRANAKVKRYEIKLLAIEYLGGCCVDCRQMPHHACMEFHHEDGAAKEFNISARGLSSWEKIKSELDKCILLCSNCHQIRHWKAHNVNGPVQGEQSFSLGLSP